MNLYLASVFSNGSMRKILKETRGGFLDVYLAGGISGNCKPMWSQLVADCIKKGGGASMDLYLAANWEGIGKAYIPKENMFDLSILESFFYADGWIESLIPYLKNFMLDSGAFTFMSSHKGKVDWNDYLKRYADFINKNDVKLFYELDIDSIVGYDAVLQMRKFLETETGKKPIPVWHKSRGKEEFLKMCEEYDYVAIGGIVSKEITSQEYKYFPWFINEAHKRGAKIHGLGFTNLEGIRKYHFDSVDSTSWTTGNRFGSIYRFNGTTMEKYDKKAGQRLADSRAVAINNFNEWIKFQKYAETNL